MGYIPIFLTMGGACILFFLTVRISMQRKLLTHKEYLFTLKSRFPEIADIIEKENPDGLAQLIIKSSENQKLNKTNADLIKSIKINRFQYNQLIKKAPYNWVAKISGFQSI